MMRWPFVCLVQLAVVFSGFLAPVYAQPGWVKHGDLIAPGDLPAVFAASLQRMGGRLTSADKATTVISGTLTDTSGTVPAQIIVQAPGYLRFQENSGSRVFTYNGNRWQAKNGKGGQEDQRVEESLLAHSPDSVFLQLANGGAFRRIGSRFRTDDGTTPNYSGPYWTLYAFTPTGRQGLSWGEALQQGYFVAIDEKTRLLSEVRVVLQSPGTTAQVTQTKFNNWIQQAGQWYPGEIIRVENARQVLKFTVQQGVTGAQLATSTFEP
jgi:hypothetical protein